MSTRRPALAGRGPRRSLWAIARESASASAPTPAASASPPTARVATGRKCAGKPGAVTPGAAVGEVRGGEDNPDGAGVTDREGKGVVAKIDARAPGGMRPDPTQDNAGDQRARHTGAATFA